PLLRAERHRELQELLRLRHRLGGHHLRHAQLDLPEVVEADARAGRPHHARYGRRRLPVDDARKEPGDLLDGHARRQASPLGVTRLPRSFARSALSRPTKASSEKSASRPKTISRRTK